MKNILMLFLALVLTLPRLAGQNERERKNQDFYSGGISIESIKGEIIINKDKEPDLNFDVNIMGKKEANEVVSIGFRGSKISKSEEKIFKLQPSYSISKEDSHTKSIKVDLVPLIEGKVPQKQIGNSNIKVELPKDYVFIRANKSLTVSKHNDNTILELKENNKYLTPLIVVFNTNGMGVSIEKKIFTGSVKKGAVTFSLNVTNTGVKELKNILIEDNFDSRDFSAQGDDFVFYMGEINDSRIIWQKKIASLKPGQNLKLEYTLTARHEVKFVSLDATKATVEGTLVGVSNKVKL